MHFNEIILLLMLLCYYFPRVTHTVTHPTCQFGLFTLTQQTMTIVCVGETSHVLCRRLVSESAVTAISRGERHCVAPPIDKEGRGSATSRASVRLLLQAIMTTFKPNRGSMLNSCNYPPAIVGPNLCCSRSCGGIFPILISLKGPWTSNAAFYSEDITCGCKAGDI